METDTHPALEEVREMEVRADDLRERISKFRKAQEEANQAVAALIARGREEEARESRGERRELALRLEEAETALPILENQIRRVRESRVREAFEERLQEIKKKAGGLAGEHPRRLERVEELRSKLEEEEARVRSSVHLHGLLAAEAGAISDLLGVEPPELKHMPGEDPPSPPDRIKPPGRRIREVDRSMGGESPSALLLEEWEKEPSEEEWKRQRHEENQERLRERKAEREEARERVDSWLRERLKDGPVVRDRLFQMAKEEELAIRRDPAEADLARARIRLEVVPVRRKGDSGRRRWWALRGKWDPTRFEEIDGREGAKGGVLRH